MLKPLAITVVAASLLVAAGAERLEAQASQAPTSSAIYRAATDAAGAASAPLEEVVLQRERAWATAIRRKDSAAYDRLVSPSFCFTSSQGRRLRIASKTTWFEILRTYDVSDFTFDDVRVRVYGNTAVVTMLATERALVAAVDRTAQYFITDVWQSEDGEWRVTERHSAPQAR